MNAPDYIGNAISFYNIQKSDAIPGIPDEKETYDKIFCCHDLFKS